MRVLGIPRSSFYYRPQPVGSTELAVMRALDEVYTATPFYGSRRLQVALRRQGQSVNRKRVQRLMRLMGIEAVGPKPRLSQRHRGHQVYPYPAARHGGRADRSGVELRHHVHSATVGIRVSGGGPGLVQPLRPGLGAVGHSGRSVLPRHARTRPGDRAAGDFQYRPRCAVHQRCLSRACCGRRGCRSAWTAAAGRSTTSSSSGSGGR